MTSDTSETSETSDTADSSRPAVPAVMRAARLLEALAEAREPLSLTELVAALGLPKSSVHGLCSTLVATGLVDRDENGGYALGVRVLDLAHAYLARTELAAEFLKILDVENPIPEESIVLSILDGADTVYVACRNGSRPFGFHFRIGMRLPANCTASGKAQLSTLPDARVTELADSGKLTALTAKSIVVADRLRDELGAVRRRGYAVDDEETREGMVCIGAPVFDRSSGIAVAAVGISVPKATLDERQESLAVHTVSHIAHTLTRRLGGPPRPGT